MAKRIKFSIIQSLFRLFSFLADRTNGWIIFVKPKILLGTIILGLNACSNIVSQNQKRTDASMMKEKTTSQQTDTVKTDTIDTYPILCYTGGSIPPQFPGGDKALMNWLSENVIYPDSAKKYEIQGKVIVNFIVQLDGSIDSVRVVESVHPILDKEAVRLVKSMPRWKPGTSRGVNVSSYFTLPVKFVLKN